MPDIASVLKSEISRIARKEIRSELEASRNLARQSKTQILELRTQLTALQKQVKFLSKAHDSSAATVEREPARQRKFSPKAFAALRSRLGISMAQMGQLIGASGQSVRLWELGQNAPRAKSRDAIDSLKGKGKREVAAMLLEKS